jgi:hypothetical protein
MNAAAVARPPSGDQRHPAPGAERNAVARPACTLNAHTFSQAPSQQPPSGSAHDRWNRTWQGTVAAVCGQSPPGRRVHNSGRRLQRRTSSCTDHATMHSRPGLLSVVGLVTCRPQQRSRRNDCRAGRRRTPRSRNSPSRYSAPGRRGALTPATARWGRAGLLSSGLQAGR